MTRHKRLTAGIGVLVVAAGLGIVPGPAAAAGTASPKVTWGDCVAYSDAALESIGLPAEELPKVRALLARTDCGTVRVPLDYHKPHGEQITVAITRLRATDQKHKRGSLAVNPGGPGGSGYLMPHELALTSAQFAELNERYDLIGFDPRGVGYSTRATCAHPGEDVVPPEIPSGPLSEATAQKIYDFQALQNKTCVQSNASFLAQLTTSNVARDLDRVRAALGLKKISYFGVSWGTLLGQVYRSLYPQSVDRMWLDSVVGPAANRLDSRFHDATAADERKTTRWAAWVAERNATYHLGRTAGEVLAVVRRVETRLDEHAIVFSDVEREIDGSLASFLAVAPSPSYAEAAAGLAALATAKSGDPVPDALRPIIGPDEDETEPTEPPADRPEQFNDVAGTAILCNDDTSAHDFPSFWRTYRSWQMDFPIAGRLAVFTQRCAGWPVPAAEPFTLRRSSGSLQLSGHRWESPTPYEWIAQVQSRIGGTVFTVDDDIHGSVARVPACTVHLEAYFRTGRPDAGGCTGVTPPGTTSTELAVVTAAVDTTTSSPASDHWHWRRH
ncbi:alpha/beta fold hydrolase [Actinoplanes sp. NPDC020271]|uniref:alpha/beta fold hydrolase n=1 Tax=Actinoplanes sp. NPDC020271 TaxID=3363896 RepID=UPI0037BC2897